MFFSLNKKILYTLLSFLLLIIGIFLTIFINFYAQNLQDNQNSIYIRNQYVVSLLYDNVKLQKTIAGLLQEHPELKRSLQHPEVLSESISTSEKELTREQQLNAELLKNYDKNREAMKTGIEIIAVSVAIVITLIFLLLFLLDYWVIHPIEKMTFISNEVSKGVLSSRIEKNKQSVLHDEFDILFSTFNQMLDSMEQDIENTKMRERFLQQLIDAVPDAIRVIDQKRNVIMENEAFKKLMQTKVSCLGRKCFEAYGYKNGMCPSSSYNCPIAYLCNQKVKSFHAIHEINNIPIYISAARLFTGKNKKNEYYVIEAMHDLRADVLFSHQQKVSSLAFLSTSVAHEMKNNLGAIRMILEGLLDEKSQHKLSETDMNKYLTMAHHQLVETVKIPERLLKMAQYNENEMTEISVNNAITDITQLTDYNAKRLGIEVNTTLEKNLSVRGSETDFKMIMLNLIQNAIKAMPDGGKLTINGYKKRQRLLIEICDTGIGIDAGKLKHIFEPFYSGNENARSSGLGLAIVNSLMNKFKGKISVESQINKGTKFTLDFQIAAQKSK
ncbi:MAG: hypothetical protein J6Y91_00565 [Alphaproteobacteria bacterium]|nr:hypothetical protein [Alphaproteobacteria bacterium]